MLQCSVILTKDYALVGVSLRQMSLTGQLAPAPHHPPQQDHLQVMEDQVSCLFFHKDYERQFKSG